MSFNYKKILSIEQNQQRKLIKSSRFNVRKDWQKIFFVCNMILSSFFKKKNAIKFLITIRYLIWKKGNVKIFILCKYIKQVNK